MMSTKPGPVVHIGKERSIDIGGLPVGRLLPSRNLKSVGPWVFFDHIGPFRFPSGNGIDVIPHPHINLATVTYLFDGEIVHRDNQGNLQAITPGAINLMSAGKGIAHSERTADSLRKTGSSVHGIQLWHALPESDEESPPFFEHHSAKTIPVARVGKARIRVLMGSAFGFNSPVKTFSPILYAEASIPAGAQLKLPDDMEEMAVYSIEGEFLIRGDAENRRIGPGLLTVLTPGAAIQSTGLTRLMIIGGKHLGKRFMWWNFVSSRRDRIVQASEDWREGRFGPVIDDEGEVAALPKTDGFSIMD